MKLTSIWSLPSYPLRERLRRTGEWALIKIAHHMPQRLAYRVYIDQVVRHLRDDEIVPEVKMMDILNRMPIR